MLMSHEQMMALRARGVRIENIFVPGLCSIDRKMGNAFGAFVTSIDPDDQIVSDLQIGVDVETDDDVITDQIEVAAAAGRLPGVIVQIAFDHMGEGMVAEVYVTQNIFEEIVDFLEQVIATHASGERFFAETVQ